MSPDSVIIINWASGFEDARITRKSDGTARVETKTNDYLATGGKETYNWQENPQVFASPREAVLFILETQIGW